MGGGDIPEDGLEAIAYAIKSDWTTEGTDQRRVIVVWTDAPTHPLGYGSDSPAYPLGMPAGLAELGQWWDQLPQFLRIDPLALPHLAPPAHIITTKSVSRVK